MLDFQQFFQTKYVFCNISNEFPQICFYKLNELRLLLLEGIGLNYSPKIYIVIFEDLGCGFYPKIKNKIEQSNKIVYSDYQSSLVAFLVENLQGKSHSSTLSPQIELLIVCNNQVKRFRKKKMEQFCVIPQAYYSPSQISHYLISLQPAIDGYYFVSCATSTLQDPQHILQIPQNNHISRQEKGIEVSSENVSEFGQKESRKQLKKACFHNTSNKREIDEQFQMGASNKKKGMLYKKKNTESNIVNQTLSFISSSRSLPFLELFFKGSDLKIQAFYRILTAIKKANRKYTNRKYLKRLIEFCQRSELHRLFLKEKNTPLTLDEMRKSIRKLVFYFLRHSSLLSLLTSAKIYKETLHEHFWRKRQIAEYLFGSLTNQNSN